MQDGNPSQPTWQFTSEEQPGATAGPRMSAPESVEWTASEFISHSKGAVWYMGLGAAALATTGVVYALTQDRVSVAVIAIMAVIVGVAAARKPRTLHYKVDTSGIRIENKLYKYNAFKSFSLVDEGPLNSISLMPLQRFMPTISMYIDPNDERRIVETLSAYLPYEERNRDMLDQFMHKIRF